MDILNAAMSVMGQVTQGARQVQRVLDQGNRLVNTVSGGGGGHHHGGGGQGSKPKPVPGAGSLHGCA